MVRDILGSWLRVPPPLAAVVRVEAPVHFFAPWSLPWGADLVKLIVLLENVAREFYGCPLKGEFSPQECRRAYGQLNYKKLREAREHAKRFFGLVEPKND